MLKVHGFGFKGKLVYKVFCAVCATWVVLATNTEGRCQQRSAARERSAEPVVTIAIPSIQQAYGDLKLVFDMAQDNKGYQTFTETLDEFLVGIDKASPSGIRLVLADGGMSSVFSAPIKDEQSFEKFLSNLWDLDVKTAPPPGRSRGQMPKSAQDKLHSLKPQKNERVVYGLTDGVLRYENGYVHLGKSLDAVRMVHGAPPAPSGKSASLTIDIRGDVSPAERRAAFEKSKQDLLSRPRREDFKDDAQFELAKAAADYQLAKIEMIVADSSQLHAAYTVSREKKASQFEGEVVPAHNTPLAKTIARIGEQPDAFAGISSDNAELVANINMPIDPALGKEMKTVAAKAKAAADARIDASSRIEQGHKDDDKDFAQLVFEVASDIAGMDTFNGVVRIWSGSEGKLTSLYGARVPSGEKYREVLRKFKHREQVQQKIQGVEISKLVNAHLQKDAPELFGAEGAVYVATSDKSIWFAAGPEAMQRLEQAVDATLPGKGAATGGSDGKQAIDVHADVQALAAAWEAVGMRTSTGSHEKAKASEAKPKSAKESKPARRAAKDSKADEGKSDHKKAISTSVISDLELHKIAGETFKKGDGKFTLSLKGEGDKARVLVTCDEGILRFVGNVLSNFTKENLED